MINSIANSDSAIAISTSPSFDLSLLPILLALHGARSVSMAAQQLDISQPGVSTALGKLRAAFDDPLFTRTLHGMGPTPRALAFVPVACDVLTRVQQGVLETGVFDPATTTHTFLILLSDVGEMVFLPRIIKVMARHMPRASMQSVSLPPAQIECALETSSLDLAVGYFPNLKKSNLFQQRLFTHCFICIVRAGHPVTRGGSARLSMAQFLEYGYAVVCAEGRSQELYGHFLGRKCVRRKPSLFTLHFVSIPFILTRTDLIATVPHAVGLSFVRSHTNVCVMEPPLELPGFDLKQHWHRKFHNDTRSQWFRALVSSSFSDEADEWCEPGHRPAERRNTR